MYMMSGSCPLVKFMRFNQRDTMSTNIHTNTDTTNSCINIPMETHPLALMSTLTTMSTKAMSWREGGRGEGGRGEE